MFYYLFSLVLLCTAWGINSEVEQKESVQILKKEESGFELNQKALREILLAPDVKDREIAVIAIAGPTRTGKSFALSFFLKYLYKAQEDQLIAGFKWRSGSKRETEGIYMWSSLFTYDTADGRRMAIALLDTQGTFDRETTMADNAFIFSLSLLASSTFIYNIKSPLDEAELRQLKYLSDHGRFHNLGNGAPFQNLLFLLRDWEYSVEYPYGASGGQDYITEYLRVDSEADEELKNIRNVVSSSFHNITGFLMPHPGSMVVGNPQFNGNISDIAVDFTKHFQELSELLFTPANLVTKKSHGKNMTSSDLFHALTRYTRLLKTVQNRKFCVN